MPRNAGVVLLVLACACGSDTPAPDPGPQPAAEHQQQVSTLQDQVLAKMYTLEGPSTYRFAKPAPDRIVRWHFEAERQTHALGYYHGWAVEYWVTPRYVGYPKQPESHRMAFFADGQLRGLFTEGLGNAPLELDKWSAAWIDKAWRPAILAEERARTGASPR